MKMTYQDNAFNYKLLYFYYKGYSYVISDTGDVFIDPECYEEWDIFL